MFESKNHLFWQQRDFLRTSHASAKFTFHIPWTFCSPPSLTQTHLCLFQSTNYPVPSFPTYCKSSVSCSQHSAVFNNASVIVCKKKKKVLQEKSLNFSPLCWSWSLITIFPISRYELSATHAKKNWSKYTRLPFIISCVQEQKFTSLIKERKKEKKKCTDH